MKKKIIILAIIFTLVISASAFSLGIGLAAGLPIGDGLPGSNLMLSAKFDQLPFLLGLAAGFDPFYMGVTADWWAFNDNLAGPLNLYAGPGLYLGVSSAGDNTNINLGVRIPIGLNIFVLDFFELFVEVAPRLGFLPTFAIPGSLGVQAAAGFRFWF